MIIWVIEKSNRDGNNEFCYYSTSQKAWAAWEKLAEKLKKFKSFQDHSDYSDVSMSIEDYHFKLYSVNVDGQNMEIKL